MRTHYDNLKVSRDAPIEVIRASFLALMDKYNPKVSADSERAASITRILITAYEVLSNPDKRAEHDRWIAETESRQSKPVFTHRQQSTVPPASAAPVFQVREKRPVNKWIVGGGVLAMAVLIAMTMFIYGLSRSTAPVATSMPTSAIPPPKTQQPLEFKSNEVEVESAPAVALHAVPAPEPKMYVAVPKIAPEQPVRSED